MGECQKDIRSQSNLNKKTNNKPKVYNEYSWIHTNIIIEK